MPMKKSTLKSYCCVASTLAMIAWRDSGVILLRAPRSSSGPYGDRAACGDGCSAGKRRHLLFAVRVAAEGRKNTLRRSGTRCTFARPSRIVALPRSHDAIAELRRRNRDPLLAGTVHEHTVNGLELGAPTRLETLQHRR